MADGTIDKIQVGLGIDRQQLASQLREAKADFEKSFPKQRTINVFVKIHTDQRSVNDLYKSVQRQFQELSRRGGSDQGLRLMPTLRVDARGLRDFRRDTERLMRQQAATGNAIHVPIKAAFNTRQFRAEIVQQLGGYLTIPIKGQWDGWAAGNRPPGGTGGGGGGGGGVGPRPAPARPAPAAPAPAVRAAPARATARSSAATMGGGAEVRSSDVYMPPPLPPTARQQRQAERRERVSGQAAARPYVTIGNVRQGSPQEELQGEDRAAYISQQRARPTSPRGQFRQANEPQLTSMERRETEFKRRAMERLERRRRYAASVQRGMSPADAQAKEHIRSGFHTLDPDLAALYDRIGDPEANLGFDQFLESASAGREAYATAFHGPSKQTRRQRGIARGYKKGDINAVDPTLLTFDAALDAARQFQLNTLDPLYAVRSGDNKLRGKGGKVGRSGGRNAGRLASSSVEYAETEARIRKERNRRIAPITPITPGGVYGGGAEMYREGEAPSIPGGQGLSRNDLGNKRRSLIDPQFLTGEGTRDESRYASPLATPLSPFARFFNEREQLRAMRERRMPGLFRRFAEGGRFTNEYMRGMYGRQIGHQYGASEGHENVARANSYEWQKTRRAQIASQPYCAHCGISRAEARSRGISLSADKIQSQVEGGDPYDPANLQTLCGRCNSRKSGSSLQPDQLWTFPRPNIAKHRALGMEGEFLPHGKYFGAASLAEIRSRKAEGGQIKHGGLLNRMAQAGHEPSMTLVGERGPELLVSGPNGETEVVPAHKVPTWLQRAQQGRGLAKDLTGRAEGGLMMRGSRGPRAATAERLMSGVVGGGDITRVFVVNWPSFLANAQQFASGVASGVGRAQAAPARAQAAAGPAAAPPVGAGAGSPAGAPAPGRARRGVIDPFDRVRAREVSLAGEMRDESLEGRILGARANITEALQQTPVRALSVAFGQIAQTAIGGRGDILARARGAQVAAGRAQRSVGAFQQLRQQAAERRFRIADITSGREQFDTPEDRAATLEQLRAQQGQGLQARIEARRVATERTQFAEQRAGGILSRGQQFKSQAVGLGGIIAGTATFSTAIAAFGFATQAAATALDPLVQSLLRFPTAVNAAQTSIRDAITGMSGQVRAGTAAAAAPSGIGAGFLDRNPAIEAVGRNRAAQVATAQALGLSRAGLRNPNEGLFEGTGGLFGTNLLTEMFGGQPGVFQDISKRLGAGRTTGDRVLGGALSAIPGGGNVLGTFLDQRAQQEEARAAQQAPAVIEDLNRQLTNAAQYAGEAGDAFQYIGNASEDLRKAMVESAAQVSEEARTRAEELSKMGIAVTGPGGRALRGGADFQRFADRQARGTLIQDPALLLRATGPQRAARLAQVGAQAEFGRREDLPAAFALNRIANPPMRFGATFSTQGADSRTLGNVARYTESAAESSAATAEYQQRGMEALESIVDRIDHPGRALGAPMQGPAGSALNTFRGLTGRIGQLGGQINAMQEGIAVRQVNLQVREYNNQIRITQRALGDAQDLWAGINGSVSDSLGGLQAQNMLLDRQNALLSRRAQRLAFKSEDIGFRQSDLQFKAQDMQFQLAQRQINFQKAVAGFTAPGLTPEERAARINEAKIEADFAQRQLNIQIQIAKMAREQLGIAKQQANVQRDIFANSVAQQDNQFAIQREEARRAVEDIAAQLSLLQEGRQITIDTAAVDAAVEKMRGEQQLLIEEAQSYLEQGQQIRAQVLQDTTDMMAATGKGFGELVGQVSTAWTNAFKTYYSNFYTPLINSINSLSGGGGSPNVNAQTGFTVPRASGGISTVSQPTTFLAGEAGSEHVIVLRNPKKGTFVGGGGMGGAGVNVGGITIVIQGTKDMDEDRLAAAVERRISTKLGMIAGRPA